MTQPRRLQVPYGAVPALDCNLEEKKFVNTRIAICDSEFNHEEKNTGKPGEDNRPKKKPAVISPPWQQSGRHGGR